MSWREARLSLQLLAEQHVGAARRQELLDAKATEDAAASAAAAGMGEVSPYGTG